MVRTRSVLLLAFMLLAGLTSPMPTAAAPVLGEGWLGGPGAVGDNTYSGVVDAPGAGVQITRPGAIQLAGWFVDRTAEGWSGADDLEIYLGTLGNGGSLLNHALFAEDRPDVAATFGRADWLRSGWTAIVATNSLLPGANVLSVYVHSPAKGWWYKQVTVNLTSSATTRATPPPQGFDIAFPQCGGPEPMAPAFAVVGVNGGRAFTANTCLARQYIWALTSSSPVQPRVAFYMNTGNPGPELSPHWPAAGITAPQPCDGSWSASCAYDYGWSAAHDAYARARTVAGDAAALPPWWLDVEVANSWSDDTTTNSADLQGSIEYLRSVNVGTIGIYALAADWETIVGAASANAPQNAPFTPLPNWRPGPRSSSEALSWCTRTVTGGRVLFVQFPAAGFDADFSCP